MPCAPMRELPPPCERACAGMQRPDPPFLHPVRMCCLIVQLLLEQYKSAQMKILSLQMKPNSPKE